uniref:Uncharacterized protein n=1 Tax=Coccidioides posadasii RMSCC 3488 TaxID=454284 RepID=A0A0J6FC00_COCPO|nr:hypothetical protein CPAG_03128 [Coccidioides posadasii RMSCC 3488]
MIPILYCNTFIEFYADNRGSPILDESVPPSKAMQCIPHGLSRDLRSNHHSILQDVFLAIEKEHITDISAREEAIFHSTNRHYLIERHEVSNFQRQILLRWLATAERIFGPFE